MTKTGIFRGLGSKKMLAALLCLMLGVAVTRIHLRVQHTLTGYNLGKLKNQEQQLLEERSFLKMQLAKLSTKKHLQIMANIEEDLSKTQALAHNL